MKNWKPIAAILVAGVFVFAGVLGFMSLTANRGKASYVIDDETTIKTIAGMRKNIHVTTGPDISEPLDFEDGEDTLAESLPELTDEDLVIKGNGDIDIELWSSPEKAGEGDEAWFSELVTAFNRSGYTVDGKTVSISLRNISSGLANDYISAGKDAPVLYSPSADIWGKMLETEGICVDMVLEKTVGNVAGLFVNTKTYDTLMKEYGNINLKTIVEATASGEIATGYTNPYTSTTGLNFLTSTLSAYGGKDILSEDAVNGFMSFQKNVPYVATTSNQMVKSAEKGSFDVYIGESQQYEKQTNKGAYKFIPFGVRHDNPVYVIGKQDEETRAGIDLFIEYIQSDEAKASAVETGFNTQDSYKSEYKSLSGEDYVSAQGLWKSAKDNGKTIVAFFIADTSGSMDGSPLYSLKESLIKTMGYINSDSYIGLITYANDVEIARPLAQFNLQNKAKYKGAVNEMQAGGATATNDAIIVALDEINKFKQDNPDMDIIPKIILLSDGAQNEGYSLRDIKDVLAGSKVPVYSIGYNYDSGGSLNQLSEVNEASVVNASTEDVITKIRDLFRINL